MVASLIAVPSAKTVDSVITQGVAIVSVTVPPVELSKTPRVFTVPVASQ